MTVVVENAMDQVEAYTNGKGVFPVPPEVAADNAKQEAKTNGTKTENGSADSKSGTKDAGDAKPDAAAAVAGDEETKQDAGSDDDKEGEDGLTPRQKREFTKAMQATIGKKHRMQREAEEYAADQYREAKLAEGRAAKLEADLAALREQLKPAKADDEAAKPKREAFKDDQEYWDAMVDYRADLKINKLRAEQAQADAERFHEETTAHTQAKMDRALEVGPEDFQEVFDSADIVLPNYVLEPIRDSDLAMEMIYYFGNNPEIATKIGAMTKGLTPKTPQFVKAAQRQLVEIGKIESTLTPFSKEKAENATKASQKTTTQVEPETGSAPSKPRVTAPIIRPLNGGSASQVEKDEADLTGSQVVSRWSKKHGVALTARKRH